LEDHAVAAIQLASQQFFPEIFVLLDVTRVGLSALRGGATPILLDESGQRSE
jgi:hypothetical protein